MMPISPAPKPKRAPPKKRLFSSIQDHRTHAEKLVAAQKLRAGSKPIAKRNPLKRARREQRNQAYYASAEWKAKKKAVHERDGYRCVERIPCRPQFIGAGAFALPLEPIFDLRGSWRSGFSTRCLGQGEWINGKQTARGLVAEEKSYGHRGIPGAIDRIVTRCKDCDRRLTPLERANHAHGFSGHSGASE